jgi:hypothetical protein
MADVSDQMLAQLQAIADAGGSIVAMENDHAEAEALGLVKTDHHGDGWGFQEMVTITNSGRKALGMDVVTPPLEASVGQRLRRFFGKLVLR